MQDDTRETFARMREVLAELETELLAVPSSFFQELEDLAAHSVATARGSTSLPGMRG